MEKVLTRTGQATVEMVLITALLVGTCVLVLDKFKEYYATDPSKNPIYQFVSGPWRATAGMIESGVWKKRETASASASCGGEACPHHPNRWHRAYSAEGQSL